MYTVSISSQWLIYNQTTRIQQKPFWMTSNTGALARAVRGTWMYPLMLVYWNSYVVISGKVINPCFMLFTLQNYNLIDPINKNQPNSFAQPRSLLLYVVEVARMFSLALPRRAVLVRPSLVARARKRAPTDRHEPRSSSRTPLAYDVNRRSLGGIF